MRREVPRVRACTQKEFERERRGSVDPELVDDSLLTCGRIDQGTSQASIDFIHQ